MPGDPGSTASRTRSRLACLIVGPPETTRRVDDTQSSARDFEAGTDGL